MYSKDNWIEISIQLSELSKAIRSQDKNAISKLIIQIIYKILSISSSYNCNFEEGWGRWKIKALHKSYI
tara:strand:- start:3899 stop:4105 length:207 start_codon:yes stop_codon:yes gene_type:complete